MKYKCNCGGISEINFNNFQEGQRCRKCGIKKITGKNNWNYNPNLTDEDRVDRRKITGYNAWVTNTYQKNNYTCQKCKKRKNDNNKYKKLNAHHIEGYAKNPNLRLDINNGITFCFPCHSKFHSIYGKKNADRQQLEEFLTV